MATNDSIKLSVQQEVVEISNRLHCIAAQLAGVKPTLDTALEDVPAGVGNMLALMGGMADYLNFDISGMAERLEVLGKQHV